MIKNLYLAIEQKLMAITDEQQDPQPLFNHCDLWNRQVEFIEQETPFQTPAVFVEIMPIQWEQLGQNVQEADLTVRFHIVTPWYANTASNVVDPDVRATALAYLDLPTVLFRQLHGQHGTVWDNSDPQNPKPLGNFNALVRTASTVNHDHERFVDSVEEYRCRLRDVSYGLSTFRVDTVALFVQLQPIPTL